MTKKRKIILISVAVTLALVMTVGGVVAAINGDHEETGGHKLIGVGEMGFEEFIFSGGIPGPTGLYTYYGEIRGWDTQFIITNPNCDPDWYLDIEWVALIAGEDTDDWDAEEVVWEGPPDAWYGMVPYYLSPHEVWQVSLAELIYVIESGGSWPDDTQLYMFIADEELNKYTLEVTWSGVYYSWWSGWRRGRPLAGWQKEKCRYMMFGEMVEFLPVFEFPGLAISEAEMKLYPRRMRFSPPFID